MFHIGIVGNGFVGRATHILKCDKIKVSVYDVVESLCNPVGLKLTDLVNCDFVFLCLPTPMNVDGSCYTGLLDDTIKTLKSLNYKNIVVRSTVPISYCLNMGVYFMPEFLTELNWKNDFIDNKHWIFGLTGKISDDKVFETTMNTLIQSAYDCNCIKSFQTIYMRSDEAELLKMVKNTFLAIKVGYFNEIYDVATKLGVNFDNVIDVLKLDHRIGPTHMRVPGTTNPRGYGGTCFPKDTNSMYAMMNANDIKSYYLQTSLDRNENYDCQDRRWLGDLNRTVVFSDKKIILVTGGAGFIGSNLCYDLVKDPNNFVICMDNLSSGVISNIDELKTSPNFLFMKHDVENKIFLPKVDMIYHLACMASPPFYQKYGIETIKTCVLGLLNVLDLCALHKCPMLWTSTSEIYGDPLVCPQSESYWGNVNSYGPRACYDESKRLGETLIYEYIKKYGLDLKIVRIFNTYGPRMRLDDGRVITNMISSLKTNTPLPIYGDGTQTRSFCYIDDMIIALKMVMNCREASKIGPINLGNPFECLSVNDLASVLSKITKKNLDIKFYPLPVNDPKQRKPDISLAKTIGWEPKIDISQGLSKTLDSFGVTSSIMQ